MKRDSHIIIVICLFFLGAAAVLFYRGQGSPSGQSDFLEAGSLEAYTSVPTAVPSEAVSLPVEQPDSVQENPAQRKECAVYISGAVKHPGVFRYSGDARVCDAIEFAGGFRKNADRASVNLARPLTDGEQIDVLTKKQSKRREVFLEDGGGADTKSVHGGLVNINQATREELMTLPGIGEAKALLIIQYREEHGPFSKPEDLMGISGIKEGVYNKMKDLITTN